MPDIVSDDDLSPLAAEFVLGTLDANERTRANVLLDVDHQFRGMVRIWERRLGELHLMVEPVEPEKKIWDRIRGKLKNVEPPAPVVAAPPEPPPVADLAPAEAMPAGVGPVAVATEPLVGLVQEIEKLTGPKAAESAVTALADPQPDELEPVEAKLAEPAEAAADAQQEDHTSQSTASGVESAPAAPLSKPESLAVDLLPAEPQPAPTDVDLNVALKAALESADRELGELRSTDHVRREPSTGVIPPAEHAALNELSKTRAVRPPRVGLWRSFAGLMMLVAIALGGLIACWRYMPERLPPSLRPTAVLHLSVGPPPPVKKAAPPIAQFDE